MMLETHDGWAGVGDVTILASQLKRREELDVRPTNGPIIEAPWSYWRSLARAMIWMREHNIKPFHERGKL